MGVDFQMKKEWRGAVVGGVVGLLYSILAIYFIIVSAFVGYSCPIKINSFVEIIFYPSLKMSCLFIFKNTGLVGLFIYSILNIIAFFSIGVLLGKLLGLNK